MSEDSRPASPQDAKLHAASDPAAPAPPEDEPDPAEAPAPEPFPSTTEESIPHPGAPAAPDEDDAGGGAAG